MVLYFLLLIMCHSFFLQAEVNMSGYLNMFLVVVVVVVVAAGCICSDLLRQKNGDQNLQTNDMCVLSDNSQM